MMATFEYNALTSSGRLMKGTIEAGSAQQASEMLTDMQLTVNEITKTGEARPRTAIGRNEFLLFNQQLASITKAGIPLDRGLRELASDVTSRSMRRLVLEIADDLSAGVPVDKAIEQRQKHFPPLYGRILRAGVETGRLSEMLTSLNRHLEVGTRTRRIILEALTYPAVVLAASAIIVTYLFLTVIPTFAGVIYDFGGQGLPWLTQMLFTMSEHVMTFWGCVLLIALAAAAVYVILSASPAGRRFKEGVLLRVPVLGRIFRCGVLARMAEAMGLLINAGCTMPQCLRLSAGASGSERMKLECEILAGGIEQGAAVMEAGHVCRMIPRLFLYSVQLGAQRNELQDNLYSLSQMYSEQTRCLQANLQAILLPAMIVILGGIISTIVVAMFLPMVRIVNVMA